MLKNQLFFYEKKMIWKKKLNDTKNQNDDNQKIVINQVAFCNCHQNIVFWLKKHWNVNFQTVATTRIDKSHSIESYFIFSLS